MKSPAWLPHVLSATALAAAASLMLVSCADEEPPAGSDASACATSAAGDRGLHAGIFRANLPNGASVRITLPAREIPDPELDELRKDARVKRATYATVEIDNERGDSPVSVSRMILKAPDGGSYQLENVSRALDRWRPRTSGDQYRAHDGSPLTEHEARHLKNRIEDADRTAAGDIAVGERGTNILVGDISRVPESFESLELIPSIGNREVTPVRAQPEDTDDTPSGNGPAGGGQSGSGNGSDGARESASPDAPAESAAPGVPAPDVPEPSAPPTADTPEVPGDPGAPAVPDPGAPVLPDPGGIPPVNPDPGGPVPPSPAPTIPIPPVPAPDTSVSPHPAVTDPIVSVPTVPTVPTVPAPVIPDPVDPDPGIPGPGSLEPAAPAESQDLQLGPMNLELRAGAPITELPDSAVSVVPVSVPTDVLPVEDTDPAIAVPVPLEDPAPAAL
ncbi:hypothetical protein [Kocuria marina]|uniref:hypothetical protein n=1 Tax=Kocuria marina TaxID=223184 RepID=UPI00345F28E4